jgi:hypothetical protein
MKKSKKSVAGHAEVWKLFYGEKDKINKDLSGSIPKVGE